MIIWLVFRENKEKADVPIPDTSALPYMPLAGLEPARCYPLDFESSASANSATAAFSRTTNHSTIF